MPALTSSSELTRAASCGGVVGINNEVQKTNGTVTNLATRRRRVGGCTDGGLVQVGREAASVGLAVRTVCIQARTLVACGGSDDG
jgi:hypothetical protein